MNARVACNQRYKAYKGLPGYEARVGFPGFLVLIVFSYRLSVFS